MSKIVYVALVASTLSGLLAAAANAEGRSAYDRNAWRATVLGTTLAPAPRPMVEGRNAANLAPRTVTGVEPYIARMIEKDRRGK